uniref:Uncharacterized protein n=1 Tax=Anguilla anguilla TaxID=7936 RepID=A0A0E9UYX8_ANGAN
MWLLRSKLPELNMAELLKLKVL